MYRSILVLVLSILLSCSSSRLLAQKRATEEAKTDKTLKRLITSLEADRVYERIQAAKALRSMGTSAAPALPALVKALHDKEMSVVIAAAQALGSLGAAGKEALPELVARLGSDHEFLVNTMAMVIGEIGGPRNKAAVRRLLVLDRPKFGGALIHDS